MSRIGKKAVELPKGVTVNVQDGMVVVKCGKKQISRPLVATTGIEVESDAARVVRVQDESAARLREGKLRARHGLQRALLQNMVTGVSKGFTKTLELHGIGYKIETRGKDVVLNLGYSHPINFTPPEGVKIEVLKGKKVPTFTVSGVDKEAVGQVASVIRSYRVPDSYQGKGVRYLGEVIRLKSGKS